MSELVIEFLIKNFSGLVPPDVETNWFRFKLRVPSVSSGFELGLFLDSLNILAWTVLPDYSLIEVEVWQN